MSEKRYLTLDKHQLKERQKYNLCPFCYKELKKQGYTEDKIIKENDLLQCLWYVKIMVIEKDDKGREFKDISETYQCSRCKRRDITVNDFMDAYCATYVVPE